LREIEPVRQRGRSRARCGLPTEIVAAPPDRVTVDLDRGLDEQLAAFSAIRGAGPGSTRAGACRGPRQGEPMTDAQAADQVLASAKQIVGTAKLQNATGGYAFVSCKNANEPP